jgi:hypothetical protein
MPKEILTDKDIEELHHRGIQSLQVNDDVVLTDLAYEKAKRLGIQLLFDRADNPPAAPVRPYLSDKESHQPKPVPVSIPQTGSQPRLALSPTLSLGDGGTTTEIEGRIRSAVIARLGNQVDATLLDNIIHRVVKATGLK